jgi:hypothetical protein
MFADVVRVDRRFSDDRILGGFRKAEPWDGGLVRRGDVMSIGSNVV